MSKQTELVEVLASITNSEQMGQFLEEILTDNERKDLSLRWKLMKLLKSGMPQRKIASELGVSLCKITRGAKIIQNHNSVSNQLIK